MMRKSSNKLSAICVLAVLILVINNALGQSIIYSGEVLGETVSLPFVNIGIPEKNIGTISNEKGKFTIAIPQSNIGDTLYFSYLGFKTEKLVIDHQNKTALTVKLAPTTEQ